MDAVGEVKARLNIEDVVSQYVQLKRAGRNFKGLSPWTNEKSASFIVSPEKQIWHDFSSGKGGDMFSFVMEMEGMDFRAALEHLARQAGVDMEQFKSSGNSGNAKLKSRALEALDIAAKFYQQHLIANKTALDYLRGRKFTKQTLLDWQLGYSPASGQALTNFLIKKGFKTDEIKRAGLAVERRWQTFDMFRGRIMIPLCDSRSAVIGFTARLMANEPDAPKYINTPQSIVYDKSRNVFGLNLAKEAIRKATFVVVVEGNMDVIASHQAGVKNVVASAGTAMTEQHLRELKRFTGDIRLCFDADRAGVTATERVIPLAQKTEVNLRIVSIEGAKDPDELIQKSLSAWQKAIDEAVYATDWLIEHYQKELDLTTASGKKTFSDALLQTIRRLRDPVEQEHYLNKIAQLTNSSLEAVKAKVATGAGASEVPRLKKTNINPAEISRETLEYQKLQNHLLAMTLAVPALRDLLKETQAVFFTEGPPRQLYDFLQKHSDFKGELKTAKELHPLGDYVKITMLQFEELYQDLPADDLREQALNLKHRLIDRYVKSQKRLLSEAMKNAKDGQELNNLMAQADKLNQLIKLKG
jgi:DNA primase